MRVCTLSKPALTHPNYRRLTCLALLLAAFEAPSLSLGQNLLAPPSDLPVAPSSLTTFPDFVTLAPSTSSDADSSTPDSITLPPDPDDADAILRKQHPPKPPDINELYYYKHRVDLSLETGGLPINLPFIFDVFIGGDYSRNPLHYTLIPIFPSIRWTFDRIDGWGPLRGDLEFTGSTALTLIPRGPETAYIAGDLGFRRNFIQRNWKLVPYFEGRGGVGWLNAAQPRGGNIHAQGQDVTFTLMTGIGARYTFNERWSMSVGATYYHVSNFFLSEPKYDDNGINVTGPLIGVYMRLLKPRHPVTMSR